MAYTKKSSATEKKTPVQDKGFHENVQKEAEDIEKAIEPAEIKEETKKLVPKDIDIHQYVNVKNGFHGRLIYKSKRTGEKFVWDGFGSEQDIELQELKTCKNTYKSYFSKNYFMFDEDWVIDYLGVRQYYKFSIPIEKFDEIFQKPADELERIVSKIPDGQKRSIAYRAKQLIADGEIDSRKAIAALEKALGVELLQK